MIYDFRNSTTWGTLTLCLLGYFYTLFVPERGKFAPLPKNCLLSDRSEIFCFLKLFFVKFLKIIILRCWRHENNVVKTSKSL